MFRLFLLSHFIFIAVSCPTAWQQGSAIGNKCYLFVNQEQTWREAENYCKKAALDGHLTSIYSLFENGDIFAKAHYSCAQYWIGLNEIGHLGVFTWTDGQLVHYTNWASGQSNNTGGDSDRHCVSLNGQTDGKWIIESCSKNNCFICEKFHSSETTTVLITPSTTTLTTITLSSSPTSMNDCYDWLHIGGAQSDGIYQIRVPGYTDPLNVWCDMTTDGGGWTVFQRRINGDLSFYDKTWNEYKNGFNNGLDKNLWLGNEYIHILSTKDSNVALRIDIQGDRGRFAQYPNIYLWQKTSSFYLDSENNNYTLHASYTVEGNASVSGTEKTGINYNIGWPFSTIDNNHDSFGSACTKPPYEFGGWWLGDSCTYSTLNGKYIPSLWHNNAGFAWHTGAYYVNPIQSRMMLRKVT